MFILTGPFASASKVFYHSCETENKNLHLKRHVKRKYQVEMKQEFAFYDTSNVSISKYTPKIESQITIISFKHS